MGRPAKNQNQENSNMVQFLNEENEDTIVGENPIIEGNINKVPEPQIPAKPSTTYVPPAKTQKFKVPEKEQVILKLTNEKRQGSVFISCTEDVIDVNNPKKPVRRARLLRGAQSIWFDEQEQFDDKYVAKNQLNLEFHRGVCTIPIHDKLRIQFATLSNRNMDNPNRFGAKDIYFQEWNPTKVAEQEVLEENNVIKAMQMAATAPIDDIIPHAQYMGIQFVDQMGQQLDETAIRNEYMKKAKNESDKFLKSIHSPLVSISHKVRKAVSEGKIDLGRIAGQAYWVDGGFISALPSGEDPVEFLIGFAQLHGESNTNFVNQLNTLVD